MVVGSSEGAGAVAHDQREAYVTIADAIEEAARAGVPVVVIATTAAVPLREVELILKDAQADEEVMWA